MSLFWYSDESYSFSTLVWHYLVLLRINFERKYFLWVLICRYFHSAVHFVVSRVNEITDTCSTVSFFAL